MIDTVELRQKYSPDGSPLRNLQMLLLDEVLVLDRICRENGLSYFLTGGNSSTHSPCKSCRAPALHPTTTFDGSPLRNLQMLLLDEVLVLDRICRENGLSYFLTGGSALGAVRHQGFIPWDDDMDIALFEDDYKKLVKILLETDSDKFVLHCRKTDFNYTFGFPKYRAKEGNLLGCFPPRGKLYKYKGYGIDVFCVSKHSYSRAWLCAKMRAALLNGMYRLKNARLRRFVTKLNWGIYGILQPLTLSLDLFRKNDEMHYGLGSGTPYHDMRFSEVFPVKYVPFEGVELPVPGDADAFLTRIFGNYMELPSEEQIKKDVHSKELIN